MTPYHYEVLNRQGMFIQSAKPRTIDQIKTDSTLRYILSRLSMIAAATADVAVVSTGPCRCRSPSSTRFTVSGKRISGAGDIPTVSDGRGRQRAADQFQHVRTSRGLAGTRLQPGHGLPEKRRRRTGRKWVEPS
jgi:hypothetical protein